MVRELSLQIEELEQRIAPDLLDDTYLLDFNNTNNPGVEGSQPQSATPEGNPPQGAS